MKQTRNPRFPLLIYQAIGKRWRGPSFLLIPAGVSLWWATRQSAALNTEYAALALIITLVGFLLFAYSLLAHNAGVRCHEQHFTVGSAIYPLNFSYRRITTVRPVQFNQIFPPTQEKAARRRLFESYWSKTTVVVDLNGYPLPLWWIKLWFSPYVIVPDGTGLVLLVEDWMGLIRQLETARSFQAEKRKVARL
ncbi:MAG: hypothetical protein JXB35_01795 [Anaerolineae bacterium]|nr:hypothetical protein [Anaerolineae bacterium]